MKNWLIVICVIIVLALMAGWYLIWRNTVQPSSSPASSPNVSPTPTISATLEPSSTPNTLSICTPTQLQAQITPQGAAGNIYGDVIIKNISSSNCQIIGNNFLEPIIPAGVGNITTSQQAQPTATTFNLAPNQTIYAQLHFPNGPQCSGTPLSQNIKFSYKISNSASVDFKTPNGNFLPVPSCSNPVEKTNIDIWAFSTQPITP